MKITFTDAPLEKAPRGVTPVLLEEKGTTRLVEKTKGEYVLVIEIENREEITVRQFARLCRKVIQVAKQNKIKRIAVQFDQTPFPLLKKIGDEAVVALMVQNFEMAHFEFTRYKTKPKEGWKTVDEVLICGKAPVSIKNAAKRGKLSGEIINESRALANTPGGEMTPKILVKETKRLIAGTKIKMTVLGEAAMKKLNMGAILGVSQGSDEEGQFIILEYKGGKPTDKPIVLVGKGVTFDTGGLSIKPADAMLGMNMDMTGGAVTIATIVLAAKLGIKKNIVTLVPAVENSPSGKAYRPGDVLRSMSGKTIEVLNTDAEGRIILADALTYAKKFKPKAVIDVATLTGAALVALGQRASAFFTDDETLAGAITESGEVTGDPVWRLPLWKEYENDIQGTFGDISNLNKGSSRYGGSISGAIFLRQFADEYPWTHIDIAPRMEAIEDDCLAKGSTGEPIGLLTNFIESY